MRNVATIAGWLNEAGFDWESGTIIWQDTGTDEPGWASMKSARKIPPDHPILTKEFDSGFGRAECPRFIAEDRERLYFPSQYDGKTDLVYVYKNIDVYLTSKDSPYPGI